MWGRFTQQDEWSYSDPTDPLSLNLYTYCGGDPVNYWDPSGNTAEVARVATMVPQVDWTLVQQAAVFAVGAAIADGILPFGEIIGITLVAGATFVVVVTAEQNVYYPVDENGHILPAAPSQGDLSRVGNAPVQSSIIDNSQGKSAISDNVSMSAEHTKRSGSKKKTNDKHTKPRPGRESEKKRQSSNWKGNPNKGHRPQDR